MRSRLMLLAAALLLAGCGTSSGSSTGAKFVGSWVPVPSETRGAIEGISAKVDFKADGTYELVDECNTVTGTWSVRDGAVAFVPRSETNRHCVVMLGFNPESATVDGSVLTVRSTDDSTWSGHMKRVD